jgi:hypothetical protein
MALLSAFKVSLTFGDISQDITDIVKNVGISESIHGDLSGYMQIMDGANVLDTFIHTNNKVIIEYIYKGLTTSNAFYLDGVKNINLTNQTHKEYTIELVSINNMINGLTTISKVFTGRTSDMIAKIYKDKFGDGSLHIATHTKNNGKYIAPNINPKTILKLLLLNSYDEETRPMFLYQKAVDGGITVLESLSDMSSKDPMFAITTESIDNPNGNAGIGVASEVIVTSSYTNNVMKSNLGVYGKTYSIFDVENSKFSKITTGDTIGSLEIERLYRKDLYGDSAIPLLNNGDVGSVDTCMRDRVQSFSIKTRAIGVDAIPLLSVGIVIELKSGSSKTNSSKHDGNYLVAGVEHNITVDGPDRMYTQDVELIRR